MSTLLEEWELELKNKENNDSLSVTESLSIDSSDDVDSIVFEEYKYYLQKIFNTFFEDFKEKFWLDESFINKDVFISELDWLTIDNSIISKKQMDNNTEVVNEIITLFLYNIWLEIKKSESFLDWIDKCCDWFTRVMTNPWLNREQIIKETDRCLLEFEERYIRNPENLWKEEKLYFFMLSLFSNEEKDDVILLDVRNEIKSVKDSKNPQVKRNALFLFKRKLYDELKKTVVKNNIRRIVLGKFNSLNTSFTKFLEEFIIKLVKYKHLLPSWVREMIDDYSSLNFENKDEFCWIKSSFLIKVFFEIRKSNIFPEECFENIDSIIMILLSNNLITNHSIYWLFGSDNWHEEYQSKLEGIQKDVSGDEVMLEWVSDIIKDNNLLPFIWIFLMNISYINDSLSKMNSLNNNFYSLLIKSKFWLTVESEKAKQFLESKVFYELINYDDDFFILIWKIIIKRFSLFAGKNEINQEELFNYLISWLSEEKLNNIYSFFEKEWINNKKYISEELLFIFSNNLEATEFVYNYDCVKYLIWLSEKWVDIQDVIELSLDQLQYFKDMRLSSLEEINYSIEFILKNPDNFEDLWAKKNILDKLSDDVQYVHSTLDDEFIISEKLLELSVEDLESLKERFYDKYKDIVVKNKSILWDRKPEDFIDILAYFYGIFSIFDRRDKNSLLVTIFAYKKDEDIDILKSSFEKIKLNKKSDINELTRLIKLIVNKKVFVYHILEKDKKYSVLEFIGILEDKNEKEYYDSKILKVFWEKYNFWSNYEIIDVIIKIWKLIKLADKETFIVYYDDSFSLDKLNSIYRVLTLFNKFWIDNLWIIEDLIDISLVSERIDYLFKLAKYTDKDSINNTDTLKKWIVEYLISWDEFNLSFSLWEQNENIFPENIYDQYLIDVINNWEQNEINKLVKAINIFLDNLIDKFSAPMTSSTLGNWFWVWSWWITKNIRQYILLKLKQEPLEEGIDYLNRIKYLNWLELLGIEWKDITKSRLLLIYKAFETHWNRLFFDWLISIEDVLVSLEENYSRDAVDLSALVKYYKWLIESGLQKIYQIIDL